METLIPYITLSVLLIICCMPAVIWWFIKYIPLLIMSCSKVCCIVLFFIVIGFFGAYDTAEFDKNSTKIEPDIDTSTASRAIVIEDDER